MIVTETGIIDDYGNDVDGYLYGISESGTRALVVIVTSGSTVADAYVGTLDGERLVGLRWECSERHLHDFAEVYEARFSGGVR